ncbi:MAG: shikimate dehydrogenase [Nitrospirae bacterium]|uniref:shikimate dehydrogenase n=1 Tax=Candidatus Magnetobacterium casense TaxID=1455061 RepID=UPI00058CAC83|nr:shikimate dehydrogenase [Candidatus Magnetobacterium casensis]MBF0336457.1 shikimate dehydrogenase [Nitrospirota bacterium]
MISAKTKVTGLLGYPVEHSLSPAMHNAGFNHLGLDYCYLGFPVHPDALGDAVRGLRALNFAGVNVTVPHKEKVIPLLDEIDEEANFIGAVNTVLNTGGVLRGFNTDGRGFYRSLTESGVVIQGKKVFIVGAGGASRAVAYYLCKEAASVHIFDIDRGKLDTLVGDLRRINQAVYSEASLSGISASDIVLNATPLGLKNDDPTPFDLAQLNPSQVVYDLIYTETPLQRYAGELGCKTLNGLSMLFWQGVLAFEVWTKKDAPVEVMRRALLDARK